MIGAINLPSDSPAEFYKLSPRFFNDIEEPFTATLDSINCASKKTSLSTLFARRKRSQVSYLLDGRKLFDGQVIEYVSPVKMWQQLIVRTFVHKLEDEIKDPTHQLETIGYVFPKLTKTTRSASTYSLVSQDRLKSQCVKCNSRHKLQKGTTIAVSDSDYYIPVSAFCKQKYATEALTDLAQREKHKHSWII